MHIRYDMKQMRGTYNFISALVDEKTLKSFFKMTHIVAISHRWR